MIKKRFMFVFILLFTAILITACAGGNNNEKKTTAGDTKAGLEVYKNNCLPCHGKDGVGGHNGPNLQDSSMAKNRDAVINQVTNGGGNMPAFRDTLSKQKIRNVAAYITKVVAPKGD